MGYLPEFSTVVVVHLLAVMSPGPDFVLISRNSLLYSRRTGVCSAIGLGMGILVHVAYCLIGIGIIISRSILIFSILKFIGAGYLIYIGYRSFGAQRQHLLAVNDKRSADLGKLAAIRLGFLTNVSNPKATLFFLALFTQVISPRTPKWIQILYGMEMSVMTFAWFAFVATVLTHSRVRSRFAAMQQRLEQAFGLVLIGLGIKVALSSPK
jgi:RhtB (resistance to homoserine/threonine) family protein